MIDIITLKAAAPLADIITEHVKLTRRGKTLWARCPFHTERTPSFAVHADYFHCHGCGASGDVIDFTARILSVSKGRAIRILAERYGVPEGVRQSRAESFYMRDLRAQAEFWWSGRRDAALEALERACARFFADQTARNEELAVRAGQQLRMIDGITPAIRGCVFLALRTLSDDKWFTEARREARVYMESQEGLMVTDWIHEQLVLRQKKAEAIGIKDPADFCLKFGGESFRRCVEDAQEWPMELLAHQEQMKALARA